MTPLGNALRYDAAALKRMGIELRVPWWRRHIQARYWPDRYRLWVQLRLLAILDGD